MGLLCINLFNPSYNTPLTNKETEGQRNHAVWLMLHITFVFIIILSFLDANALSAMGYYILLNETSITVALEQFQL